MEQIAVWIKNAEDRSLIGTSALVCKRFVKDGVYVHMLRKTGGEMIPGLFYEWDIVPCVFGFRHKYETGTFVKVDPLESASPERSGGYGSHNESAIITDIRQPVHPWEDASYIVTLHCPSISKYYRYVSKTIEVSERRIEFEEYLPDTFDIRDLFKNVR